MVSLVSKWKIHCVDLYSTSSCYLPACDYLGERMASLFGITSAKYQYAIDEYYRMKKEVCCREVQKVSVILF